MTRSKAKVLLIGWDAADWKFLSPLMDEGLMPNLSKLVEGGVKGKLATLDPPLSPMLWTSIATGKRPYKHGIHGFTEPDPSGKGIRPINSTNRKVKAIWNILTQNNISSNIIGWWPSHPAEPIKGSMVSNFYQNAGKPIHQEWTLVPGTVWPPEISDILAKLRVHPQELTEAHILPFVPDAFKIDQSRDKRLVTINKITADCSSIHSAATYLMENSDWDFTAVYFDALDHYCHAFMQYHPPYREHIDRKSYDLYKDVVRGGCIYHDMMLGRLMELVGTDTTIMLISDHGFHPDHNRPKSIPKEPSGPAIEHSPYGIIVVNGPNIRKDELIFGASLLDITPTLLSLFGLPAARDMDGKVLSQIYEKTPNFDIIDSWENIDGNDGSHRISYSQTPEEMESELQQLIDLGYISDPKGNVQQAIQKTKNENKYYLARAYLDGQQWEEGIALLEELQSENPEVFRYARYLLHGYQQTGQYILARRILDKIKNYRPVQDVSLDIIEAGLLVAENRQEKALSIYHKIEKEADHIPGLRMRIAKAYLQLNKTQKAEELLMMAIEDDPEDAHSHYTLGLCYYKNAQYEQASEKFIDSIALLYFFPSAHFLLGESLIELGRYQQAVEAFEVCLKLFPSMNRARNRIITIYNHYLNSPGLAQKYILDMQSHTVGEIIIVSGLPRSGTSMMMQMLEAGGLEIYTDEKRSSDASNPKGYYEHDKVKNLIKDKKWLSEANGKGVKVIAQLIPHLPLNYRYKIIFMQRNIIEVIQSQQKMLKRDGKVIDAETLPLHLVSAYEATIEKVKNWAKPLPNVELLEIPYASVVKSPFEYALMVRSLLTQPVDPQRMASVVDVSLYREKIVQKSTN